MLFANRTGFMRKELLGAIAALSVALCVAPGAAFATGIQSGAASFTVDSSRVVFAGHEWWVIGDATSGVYQQAGHATLLAAADHVYDEFGDFRFREQGSGKGYSYYGSFAYADNPVGLEKWNTPNEYAGSTLQQAMVSIANELNRRYSREWASVTPRTLTGEDGIAGQQISDQSLWALSYDEADLIRDDGGLFYPSWWWLRSGSDAKGANAWLVNEDGGTLALYSVSTSNNVIRPALSFDLASVEFTSSASSENGKSTATVGEGLQKAEAASDTLKFTMKDSSQTLSIDDTSQRNLKPGETLELDYSNATTGKNQYVSCVLVDADGDVVSYGKLVDCSDEAAASGALSISLTGVEEGSYTLKVFSEQANRDKTKTTDAYTDFCSEPIEINLTIHDHDWSTEWAFDATHHWHACSGCDERADEAEHIDDDSDSVCDVCAAPLGSDSGEDGADSENGADDSGNDMKKSSSKDSQDKSKDDTSESIPQTGDGSPIAPVLVTGFMGVIALAMRRRASLLER